MLLEFYEKRRLKRLVFSKPFLVFMGIVACFLALPTWSAYEKMSETKHARIAIAAELDELKEREHELEQEIERLETPRGIEEEIRQKYEVGRGGEEMILIVDPQQEEESDLIPLEEKSFFEKLKFWKE